MGWETSTRRDGLPRWWPVTVRRILARDPKCKCPGCIKCNTMGERGRCMMSSAEVDHIERGDDHRDVNLRGMCRPCHGHKSSREGLEAREAKKKPTGFFDEPHPGRL
jgi:5-methylcytosine-specific restriction protein A